MLANLHNAIKFSLFSAVSLIAFSTLLFEVLLSRILAVTVWYHFGFAIVSLAMLGVSVGAILCPRFKNNMSLMAGLFACSALLSIVIHLHGPPIRTVEENYFWVLTLAQLMVFFVTFLFSGICLGAVFVRFTQDLHKVYFFDMVGASLGCLSLIPLLFMVDGPSLIFIVFSLGCLAAAAFTIVEEKRHSRYIWLTFFFAGIVLFYANQKNEFLKIRNIKSYELGEFQQAEAPKIFEKWSPLSRVALFESKSDGISKAEGITLTVDGGAPAYLRKFDGNYSAIAAEKNDCRQIGQRLHTGGNVLVIGSGGGIDILMSLALGKDKITAVDINPVTADLVKGRYASYIGNIFDDPRVTLHVQDGRNFVAGSKESYDLIHLTMVDTWTGASAGAFVFNENSLYTKQAIEEFVHHLNPNGMLSITRYSHWNEGLRLVNTIAESLEESGVKNLSQRIAVFMEMKPRLYRVTILLKNGLFTSAESQAIGSMVNECGGAIVSVPQMPTDTDKLTQGGKDIQRFIATAENLELRKQFVASHDKNIEATTDDKPFFFFTTKISRIFENSYEHAARRYAVWSLLVLLGISLLYSVVMAMAAVINLKRQRSDPQGFSVWYFALVGAGFMIIEISFTQKLTALLGHPAWSFLTALTGFLFSSACGSYFSKNMKSLKKVLAVVVLLTFIYQGFLYDQMSAWLGIPLWMRFSLTIASIFPLGFFMGMCFPMGIRMLTQGRSNTTALAWALNGAFSVVGSVSAVVIAVFWGFKLTLLVGGLLYLAAVLLVWKCYLESDSETTLKN